MERIAKIIRTISEVYDISMPFFVSKKKDANLNRKNPMRLVCYFCYESMLEGLTKCNLQDIRRITGCSVFLILKSHKEVREANPRYSTTYYEREIVKIRLNDSK